MKLRIVSDLHLDFIRSSFLDLEPNKDEVLVFAGDTFQLNKKQKYKEWLQYINDGFRHVLWVPGNHEYYSSNLPNAVSKTRKYLDEIGCFNIAILDNDMFLIDNIVFLGTTLWTTFNGNAYSKVLAQMQMNDYRCIRTGPDSEPWLRKLSTDDTAILAHKNKSWIESMLEKYPNNKVVLITHHGVGKRSVGRYNSDLNDAYYYNIEDLFEKYNIELAIHGHSHESVHYNIDSTRVISNPKGYPGENKLWDKKMVINV